MHSPCGQEPYRAHWYSTPFSVNMDLNSSCAATWNYCESFWAGRSLMNCLTWWSGSWRVRNSLTFQCWLCHPRDSIWKAFQKDRLLAVFPNPFSDARTWRTTVMTDQQVLWEEESANFSMKTPVVWTKVSSKVGWRSLSTAIWIGRKRSGLLRFMCGETCGCNSPYSNPWYRVSQLWNRL